MRETYVVLALQNWYEDGCKLVNPTILMPTIRPRTGENKNTNRSNWDFCQNRKRERERDFSSTQH